MQRFEFKKIALEEPLFKEVLALRYQVYCEERGFESPEDHPDGLEQDEYEEVSVHFAAIDRITGRAVATVRLVLNSERNLPGTQFYDLGSTASGLCSTEIGEVSRLALTKRYRREMRRRLQQGMETIEIVNGLFGCLALESGRLGLTHLYAVMSRGLPVLLAKNKICFNRIGPDQEYHGRRAPYFGAIEEIVSNNSELYNLYRNSQATSRVA